MNEDEAVQALYEAFPYPRTPPDLEPIVSGAQAPLWNPKHSFSLYFPEERPHEDLDILIAGCGTTAAPMMAAALPEARVVAIDISEASLEISRGHAKEHMLENLELRRLAIEEVGSLEMDFDFIHCHGVLHHLKDPVAGLRALGGVLRPEGAMSLMVYAQHGRYGLYLLQDMCRRLGLGVNEQDGRKVQALLTTLPHSHPFSIINDDPGELVAIEEVMDMLLHPRDVAYTATGVRDLVDGAGLRFHRWLGQAQYLPEASPLIAAGLGPQLARLDRWGQAQVMELFHGTIIKHQFAVTHPERATPEQLFAGDSLLDAVPRVSAHLQIDTQGDELILSNRGHDVPVQLRAPRATVLPILNLSDHSRTVGQILVKVHGAAIEPATIMSGLSVIRRLYQADALELRLASR